MKLRIITPGPLSTVQDLGRFGYMDSGFSPGGAMDSLSMRLANIIVGNSMGEGVIEMTLSGVTAEFDCECVIALTGADMSPKIGGRAVSMYEAVQVKKGDVLTLGMAENGMRSYLAVCGGFDLEPMLGSVSTNLKCGLGGYKGRRLQALDEIGLRGESSLEMIGRRRISAPKSPAGALRLRTVSGPQQSYFTEEGLCTFYTTQYFVTDKSDRMGIRLDGAAVESKNGVDIISDPIATGSIQIPASGKPIIMMADRQTTGGYAKIANVITADLPSLAQARPQQAVYFELISGAQAVGALRRQQKWLKWLEYSMKFMK